MRTDKLLFRMCLLLSFAQLFMPLGGNAQNEASIVAPIKGMDYNDLLYNYLYLGENPRTLHLSSIRDETQKSVLLTALQGVTFATGGSKQWHCMNFLANQKDRSVAQLIDQTLSLLPEKMKTNSQFINNLATAFIIDGFNYCKKCNADRKHLIYWLASKQDTLLTSREVQTHLPLDAELTVEEQRALSYYRARVDGDEAAFQSLLYLWREEAEWITANQYTYEINGEPKTNADGKRMRTLLHQICFVGRPEGFPILLEFSSLNTNPYSVPESVPAHDFLTNLLYNIYFPLLGGEANYNGVAEEVIKGHKPATRRAIFIEKINQLSSYPQEVLKSYSSQFWILVD